jgi:Cu+-exporting ATPase
MGLATPTSIMVGTGRAAELGVLFRKGQALQTLRDARVVALDKTGTLTNGKPELTDFVVQNGFDADDTLSLLASIEHSSEHPIAEAIVRAAQKRQLPLYPVNKFVAVAGMGVRASVRGHDIFVGADRFMRQQGVALDRVESVSTALAAVGKSPLYAMIDGQLAAVIASLRSSALMRSWRKYCLKAKLRPCAHCVCVLATSPLSAMASMMRPRWPKPTPALRSEPERTSPSSLLMLC